MSSRFTRLVGVAALAVTLVAGSAGRAHAWYKISNKTPNLIFLSHAFNSTSVGIFCGWDDGCDDRVLNGYHVRGWFHIAAGATVTIQTSGWGNAWHQIFANDQFGHVWGGNGDTFGTPNTVFDHCEPLFSDLNVPNPRFLFTSTHRCCGGSCPSNKTDNLVL